MKILLAEDEKSLSKALVSILKRSNYLVDAVYNGQEALEYLQTGVYDLLILDIMMPKKDGISVLKELRQKGNSIPVLILTAKSELDDKVLGLDCGADDYLTKPFVIKELLARIRALSRRINRHIDDILAYGNITLNRSTFELSNGNDKIILLNKEFQMLELLMLNPNVVVPTERIMDKIWGYDSDSDINVVWTYVSYLRRKLDSLNANFKIKATRNIGYSLVKEND